MALRILIVSGIWPPDVGGPASHGPSVGAFLAARGHDVRAVVSADGTPPDPGFPIRAVDRRRPLAGRLRDGAAALVRAAAWADVVYATGIYSRSALATALRGVPLVLKLVNDPAFERARNRGYFAGSLEEFQRAGGHPGIVALKALRWATLAVPRRIVVPSRYLARFAGGWGVAEDRIDVIHNPAPAGAFAIDGRDEARRALGLDGPTAVFAGRFVPQKNLPLLLEAFAEVPVGRLALVGDGEEREAAMRLAERLGLGERVRFVGAVDRAGAALWMRAADVSVLPSSWENFPHAAVESLAGGTPVVATTVGGVPEIVRDGVDGALVPPGDRAALAGALGRLLADPETLAPMRAAAAAGARRFDEAETFARLEAVLRAAAGQDPRPA